jgi:hypothetical protein
MRQDGPGQASVTHGFRVKTRCSSYICPGSSCHTYGQNVNIENHCLYYINFITRNIFFTRRLGRLSRRATAQHTNPTGNRPRETLASRRSLHHKSLSHLQLLSSVIARVSRLMVATQQVMGKHNNIHACSNKLCLIAESILHVRFIYISNVFTK